MKNLILFLTFFILFSFKSSGQLSQDPETGKVTLQGIHYVDSVSQEELFERGQEWSLRTFKSLDQQVIFEDDKKSKIISNGTIKFDNKLINGVVVYNRYVNFKFSLFFKDGRYKYIIESIHIHQELGSNHNVEDYSMERIYQFKQELESKEKRRRRDRKRLENINSFITMANSALGTLSEQLEQAMQQKTEAESEDW